MCYLTLEVRTLFQGQVLTAQHQVGRGGLHLFRGWPRFGDSSAASQHRAQIAAGAACSAEVVLLTIDQGVPHDLAGVTGIFRALSFIWLGCD